MTDQTNTDTITDTITIHDISQHAGEDWIEEFRALRDACAQLAPDEIATYEFADDAAIVADRRATGVDLWGKGYPESSGEPMTNAQVVRYLDAEIAEAERVAAEEAEEDV